MPAEPGADIGIVSAFSVCMTYCSSTFTSSIRSMNRGSRCPIVGRPSASNIRGGVGRTRAHQGAEVADGRR